jgi:primary-amine oxidase
MCKLTDSVKEPFAHPLDPLSKDEIVEVAKIAREAFTKEDGEKVGFLRFETIELFEPPKATVRAFEKSEVTMADIERKARVNAFYVGGGIGVYRLAVSLTQGKVLSKTYYPEARPMIQLDEFMEVEDVVRKDPRVIEAFKTKYGVTDMSKVCVDPWSSGTFGEDYEKGRHLSYTFMWIKSSEYDNLYAHPVEGLNVVVDIKAMEVVAVEEREAIPIPEKDVNYDAELLKDTPVRTDLKEINVTQPDGVSFTMEGNTLKWHDWSILIGFNAREGITLHNTSFAGRPMCYRMSSKD